MQNHIYRKNIHEKIMSQFVFLTESSDGLVLVGAKVSADTVLMFGSRIIIGPADDWLIIHNINPDSKVHGEIMGPIWVRQDPGGPHGGPVNLAIWECNGRTCNRVGIRSYDLIFLWIHSRWNKMPQNLTDGKLKSSRSYSNKHACFMH